MTKLLICGYGEVDVPFDCSHIPAGVYALRLSGARESLMGRLLVVR